MNWIGLVLFVACVYLVITKIRTGKLLKDLESEIEQVSPGGRGVDQFALDRIRKALRQRPRL